MPDLDAVIEVVASLADRFPVFERPTEYMALWNKETYALYDGIVQTVTPDGETARYALDDYRACTNEYVVPQSTAKYTRNRLPSYMAGALARFNNNYAQLRPEGGGRPGDPAAAALLQPVPEHAQLVEIVHSVHASLALLERV